jgi:enoyl-CoA hydratase/carnithine racemase
MLTLSQHDGVAILTLDRRDKKNAITRAMWERFPEMIGAIERDTDIRAVIITGRGDAFAAGADIAELAAVFGDRTSADSYLTLMSAAQDAVMGCEKPTIAMIRGACIGAGCGLSLSCDIRFSDPTGKFGVTPAKLGMIYSLADTRRLVDAVGLPVARDLLLSGRIVDADEAARIGLVNRVVPAELLEATTRTFAMTLAANAPSSIRGIKAILAMVRAERGDDAGMSRALFLDVLAQPEFAEALAAFRDKRPPRF